MEITFELMALGAVGIEHLDRWCPLRAEALEDFWLLFDVDRFRLVIAASIALMKPMAVSLPASTRKLLLKPITNDHSIKDMLWNSPQPDEQATQHLTQ